MTKRYGKVVLIEAEKDQICEQCGAFAETRPYGPNGTRICFDCGEKDPEGTEQRMGQALFGNRGV